MCVLEHGCTRSGLFLHNVRKPQMARSGNFYLSGTAGSLEWNLRASRLVIRQSWKEKETREGLRILLLPAQFPVETFCRVIHLLTFRSRPSPPAGAVLPPLQPQHLPEEAPGRWAESGPAAPSLWHSDVWGFSFNSAGMDLALLPSLLFLATLVWWQARRRKHFGHHCRSTRADLYF